MPIAVVDMAPGVLFAELLVGGDGLRAGVIHFLRAGVVSLSHLLSGWSDRLFWLLRGLLGFAVLLVFCFVLLLLPGFV